MHLKLHWYRPDTNLTLCHLCCAEKPISENQVSATVDCRDTLLQRAAKRASFLLPLLLPVRTQTRVHIHASPRRLRARYQHPNKASQQPRLIPAYFNYESYIISFASLEWTGTLRLGHPSLLGQP